MKENLKKHDDASFKAKRLNLKSFKGITLVALVVTIVVLLILAGITITTIFSDNGIISNLLNAKNLTEKAVADEQSEINSLRNEMLEYLGENKMAAGLYDENDELIYNWQQLLDKGWLMVENGILTSGCVHNVNPNENNIAGKLVIDSSVTEIGEDGLNGLTKMFACVLPENIKLNDWCFQNTGITSVGEYGSGAKLELPKGTDELPQGIFYDCDSLSGVISLNSVKNIGERAFAGCSNLTGIIVNDDVESVGRYAFSSVPVVCYSGSLDTSSWSAVLIHKYDENAVCEVCKNEYYDKNYTNGEIEINNKNAYMIGYERNTAKTLNIPGTFKYGKYNYTVTSIGESTFSSDTAIETVTIPNTVTKIGKRTLMHCSNLKEINIPASVVDIGDGLGGSCKTLQRFNVSADNPKFMDIDGICYSKSGKTLIACPQGKDCTNFIIPDKVEVIGEYAFRQTNINTITTSSKVKRIGKVAFSECNSLTKVNLGSSRINCIELLTFSDCEKLNEVLLPDSLTKIDAYAFGNCSRIKNINIPGNVQKIGELAFDFVLAKVTFENVFTITEVGDYAFSFSTFANESDKQAILNCNPKACSRPGGGGTSSTGSNYVYNGVE